MPETNKKHRLIFFLVCLGLAVLLGWPSVSYATTPDYRAGARAGFAYAKVVVQDHDSDFWNGLSQGIYDGSSLVSYHDGYDPTGPNYGAGYDLGYYTYFAYSSASADYQSGFDFGVNYSDTYPAATSLPSEYYESGDSYTLTAAPFSGVVSTTGGFINSMIARYGVPAILVGLAVAGWLFLKRITRSAFH
jgi:hypothetical protein